MANIWEELAKPFDPNEVELKVQATTQDRKRGMVVAYVDARTVMVRLDVVICPGYWRVSFSFLARKAANAWCGVLALCVPGVSAEIWG